MSKLKQAYKAYQQRKKAHINNKWLVETGQLIMRQAVHRDIAANTTWAEVIATSLDQVLDDYQHYFTQVYSAKVYLDDLGAHIASETLERLNQNQLTLLRHSIGKEAEAVLGALEQQVEILTGLRNAFRNAGPGALAQIELRLKVLQGPEVTAEDVEGGLRK